MNPALPFLLIAAVAAAEPSAEDVIAQVRAALGAEKRSPALQGLSLEAELRRVQPMEGEEASDISGEVTVDLRLPDRYLKIETLSPFPGAPAFSIGTGLDGAEAWRARVGGGDGGPHVFVRVSEGQGPDATEALLRHTRHEMRRLLLVALALSPDDVGLTVAYAGEAEAPEGRADRLDISDAQGRVGTLFVDKATHRPLFLSFRTQAPRLQVMRVMRPAEREQPHPPELSAMAPAPEVEARLYVSEWKAVDGLVLPHRLSQTMEGGAREEWTIQKWKLDPAFKADHFRRRK